MEWNIIERKWHEMARRMQAASPCAVADKPGKIRRDIRILQEKPAEVVKAEPPAAIAKTDRHTARAMV
jgi:hypothetical protein